MIIISNTPYGSAPPAPPLKENGELYAYRCHFGGLSRIAFADTFTELVSLFIPGYESLPPEDQDVARLKYLRSCRTFTAAGIISMLKPDDVNDEEYAVLNQSVPSGWSSTGVDMWSSKIPLILLAQDYAPYTEVQPPLSSLGDAEVVSNLVWLDAIDDESFVRSLDTVGEIVLSETFGR